MRFALKNIFMIILTVAFSTNISFLVVQAQQTDDILKSLWSSVREFQSANDSTNAFGLLSKIADEYPEHPDTAEALWLLSEYSKEMQSKKIYLERLYEKFSTTKWAIKAMAELADYYLLIGQPCEAHPYIMRQMVAQLGQKESTSTELRIKMACTLIDCGKLDRAISLFGELRTPDSEKKELIGLFSAYARLKNGEKAAAFGMFSQFGVDYPNSVYVGLAMLGKAKAALEMGQREQAANMLNEIINSYPDSMVELMAKQELGLN